MADKTLPELFNDVVDGWEYGIRHYPGEIYPELIYSIVREMKPDLYCAVQISLVIDIASIAERFAAAAKYLVPEKEIAFHLLSHLPAPHEVKTEDQLFTLGQIVDKVDQVHEGALERVEKRWKGLLQSEAA